MNRETRSVSCIVCPMGCVGEVELEDGKVVNVTGFTCERGKKYGREEVTAPKRMLTTTVRVTGGQLALVPVVSSQPLPKSDLLRAARCLAEANVPAPVEEGQVIVADLLGLGVDIIATRSIAAAND